MVQWSELLSGLVGSLIGGALAIIGAIWGAHFQHRAQEKLTARADVAEVEGYLGALHAEMTVLWGSFHNRVSPALTQLPEGSVFNFRWPARNDYFTVYNSNAHLLGRVPSAELRTLIITTYTAAKGMLDSLGYNGEAVQRLSDLKAGGLADAARGAQIAISTAHLIEFARELRDSGEEFAGLVRTLLPQLTVGLREPPSMDRRLKA
jgi:hypothetical protein